ncbi:MAG: AAA family ATPase [Mycobacterium sp.]
MTSPVLDFDGRVIGRQHEFGELRAAVEAASRVDGTCVLISGVPGVGKSTLMQAFGAEVAERNCVFAYGRCRDGASAPYSALRDAFVSLVRAMEAIAPAERDRWRAGLLSGASTLAGVLGDLVPELTEVLGASPGVAGLNAADARRRLHRAAIRLISETATYRPVVLAIDDLQRADRDSLLLLSELVTVSPRNVLLLGAHRAGEFDAGTAGLTSTSLRQIDLQPLSRGDVEELLATASGHGVELGDVAAEFHHRTEGNPLQVRQLLYRAQQEGALAVAGPGRTPSWDLRVLAAIEFTATAAESLGRYLEHLRPIDREVLRSLTCIGGEFDLDDAAAAAAQPSDVVAQALWVALELRLLESLDHQGRRIANAISHDARYQFSHDRVAEVAAEGLSADAQRQTHLRIGRRLVTLGDDRLFEAARHVGIGGLGLSDERERIHYVDVLGRAARKARAQASFPLALDYCRKALAILGDRRWDTHLSLSRGLLLDAAEAALLVGDIPALHTLLDEADAVLTEPADRARLAYLRIKGRLAQNRLQGALETGLTALDELGEPLPRNPNKPRMGLALLSMKLTMRRWSNEQLLELPYCEDQRVIAIQRILGELFHICYSIDPNYFPLLVRKQLDLTLAHGHTPASPLMLANYAILLAVTGDRAGSQRFGEVGLTLAERPEFREAHPHTLFIYLHFVRHWRYPVRQNLSQLRDAIGDALDQGDQEFAGYLAAALLAQSFWLGRPMAEIDALAQSIIPGIRSQLAPATLCQAVQQICLNLMGRSGDVYLLAGESGYDERIVVPAARLEGDVVALSVAATMKLGLYFWCGDYAGAVTVADEAIEHISGMNGNPVMQLVHLTSAMSRIHAAPKDRTTRRAVRTAIALHRKWAKDAPANYAAPCALIEGTWARARGQHRRAEEFLEQAIELAEEHQLPLIAAAAYTETATLYAETGRTRLRQHMLRSAYQRFLALGMTVRTDRLARAYPWLLSRDLVQDDSAGIDPAGAHHLVRALSAARTPDGLARLVLGTVAEMTGAIRVIALTGQPGQLQLRAVHERGDTSTVDGPWTEVPFDRTIIDRVVETGAPVIVMADPVRRTPSVLAAPMILQDAVIGVVYAEQDGLDRSFTPDHEDAVAFVCAQAAAPLWNFQLEARLRAADEHRQSLIDVQSRFVPSELLRILDIDDVRRVRGGYRVERRLTVLISDIRGYTTLLEEMDVAEASNLAMGFLRAVELPIIACNGMVQDMRGDEVLAVFESEPDNALRAGLGMLRSLREHNRERLAHASAELRIGIGINFGTVGVGLVSGVNRMVPSIIGDAVNLAARIEGTNKRYDSALLISDSTYAALVDPDQFHIRRMERVMVVNRRRPVTVYEVYDEDPELLRQAKCAAQPAFDEAFALFDAGDIDRARVAFEFCQTLLPNDAVATLHVAHCDAAARGELPPGGEVALLQK